MAKKLSYNEFLKRSYKIHGKKYDYSNVNYINNRINVSIVCPIHGKFLHSWSQKAPSALAKGMNDDHIKEIKIK